MNLLQQGDIVSLTPEARWIWPEVGNALGVVAPARGAGLGQVKVHWAGGKQASRWPIFINKSHLQLAAYRIEACVNSQPVESITR